MPSLRLSCRALTLTALLAPLYALAAPPTQPPRWVTSDDVRVRSGPGADYRINGLLPRGAQLVLKATAPTDGYCFIEGEGQYGYVACNFLSATPVARPRAGVAGVDPAQRWVSGNSVTLRDAARPDAVVLQRLSLNTIVKLMRDDAGGGYCQVQPATGEAGFTACRYLAPEPTILANVMGLQGADQPAPPGFSPERAFWLQPSWSRLESYADFLVKTHPGLGSTGPWPRDEALEKMKAHLALGLKGDKPAPFPDWAALKRKAAADLDLTGKVRRMQEKGETVAPELAQRDTKMKNIGNELQNALGLWGPDYDAISSGGGAEHTINLVRALEFPAVQASLFRSESDLAPGNASTEQLSGRFGIIFRQLVSSRARAKAESEQGAGLYDMLARTQSLVKPVQRVLLMRDGQLRAEASNVTMREVLWRETEEPECAGWVPGFSFGQADPAIWRYFNSEGVGQDTAQSKLNLNPAGSLYQFYTTLALPTGPARKVETAIKLDRDSTGFVRGIHLHYDLDGDGVPDLSVWEGQGKGPGHMDGMTKTDDRWYRLVLVNINGAWKVLGSDSFAYGCGC
ncbi:MAG: SH3 domain-containing protein [Massilia sp.]